MSSSFSSFVFPQILDWFTEYAYPSAHPRYRGAGFVGSSVALALKRSRPQAQVTAFDNLHRRGSELNLSRLRDAGVAFAHGDIRSLADLTGLPEPPDLIVECSAEPSAQAAMADRRNI
jgi:CDP-paratose 2-epimerase